MNRVSQHRRARHRQAGWSLLESVVVVAVVGVMVTGFWKTLDIVERKSRSDEARDTLQRAEDALQGLALRDHRLPMPDDATASTQQPDHWEGWLPEHVLGTEPPRSIRYVVDSSLAAPPGAIYRADPLNMLSGGATERTALNGFDFCLNVYQREQTAFATIPGSRLAFGVQGVEARDRASGDAGQFRFQESPAGTGQTAGALNTRATGYLEMVHRLGCIPALGKLATAVKAATLATDLHNIAAVNVQLRGLAIKDAEDALVNHEWRLANSVARLGVSSWNLVATKLTGATTPVGALKMATNIVGFTFEATRWVMLMDYSIEKMNGARADLEAAIPMWEQARNLAQDRDKERAWRLEQVNLLQGKGLLP